MKIKLTIILLFFLTSIFCQNNTDNDAGDDGEEE